MRKGKRARLKANAWLFGLAVPAVALFVLFSLMPYDRMVQRWPLGIRQDEVMLYQRFFDRRPGQHAEGQVERWTLEATAGGCESGLLLFSADDRRDSVSVAPLDGGGWVMDFPAQRSVEGRNSLALVPATLRSLRAKYAQMIADSLGLRTPEVTLAQLVRCGKDLGTFLVQERITEAFVRREASYGTVLLQGEGDSIQSAVRADRIDTAAVAALALMACGEERAGLLAGSPLVRDAFTGHVTPLYAMDGMGGDTLAGKAFRSTVGTAEDRRRVEALAARLRADSAAWSARLRAIDSTWVPVLAAGRNIGLVQAEVDRTREDLLRRFFHPDLDGLLGPVAPALAERPTVLDPWLKPFLTEPDTLRFRRGKYAIDHDLIIPKGMALVLEKGTRWNIAPGVRVLVQGELHIRGTALNPVFLRPEDPAAPYATLAVQGEGRTPCRIRGLRMSGGQEAWIDGLRYAGMLSLHGVDAVLTNSDIGEAFGPAAVEVADGRVRVEDCTFADAHHGTLDLARMEGAVERCTLTGAATDGSALRMNGSSVLVRGCSWTGVRSVALEAGHRTQTLVLASSFKDGGTAIAAADGAAVHVDGCTFTGNATVFSLRAVHAELGPPVVTRYANTLEANARESEGEALGRLGTSDQRDPQVWRMFGSRP